MEVTDFYMQWRIQRLSDAVIPVWAPKQCAQINEKLMQNNGSYLIISSTQRSQVFNLCMYVSATLAYLNYHNASLV